MEPSKTVEILDEDEDDEFGKQSKKQQQQKEKASAEIDEFDGNYLFLLISRKFCCLIYEFLSDIIDGLDDDDLGGPSAKATPAKATPTESTPVKSGSSQGAIVDCWICDDVFIGVKDLKNHMVTIHGIEPAHEKAAPAKATPAKATPAKATPAANNDLGFYGNDVDDDHIARNEQNHEDWLAKNVYSRQSNEKSSSNQSNVEERETAAQTANEEISSNRQSTEK